MQIILADTKPRIREIQALFLEYAQSLGFDLEFQGFKQEMDDFPGSYNPPGGRLLLACAGGQPVGGVGLRRLADDICELKRLYVRPAGRGRQIGRMLVGKAILEARKAGYRFMRLDTLPSMRSANQLYVKAGFYPIEAYCHNPIEDAIFMELDLQALPNAPAAPEGHL